MGVWRQRPLTPNAVEGLETKMPVGEILFAILYLKITDFYCLIFKNCDDFMQVRNNRRLSVHESS